METTAKPLHIGRKISRLRELRGMKQDALADALGVSQQTISRMEASETVANDLLEKVANVLGVSSEAIKNFNEESIFNIISNTYHDHASSIQYNFNPIDKLLEAYDENKQLYERLLQSEKEKVIMLENLLKGN